VIVDKSLKSGRVQVGTESVGCAFLWERLNPVPRRARRDAIGKARPSDYSVTSTSTFTGGWIETGLPFR
jgi:hypothetical protein